MAFYLSDPEIIKVPFDIGCDNIYIENNICLIYDIYNIKIYDELFNLTFEYKMRDGNNIIINCHLYNNDIIILSSNGDNFKLIKINIINNIEENIAIQLINPKQFIILDNKIILIDFGGEEPYIKIFDYTTGNLLNELKIIAAGFRLKVNFINNDELITKIRPDKIIVWNLLESDKNIIYNGNVFDVFPNKKHYIINENRYNAVEIKIYDSEKHSIIKTIKNNWAFITNLFMLFDNISFIIIEIILEINLRNINDNSFQTLLNKNIQNTWPTISDNRQKIYYFINEEVMIYKIMYIDIK
jgi:hypothetical protein